MFDMIARAWETFCASAVVGPEHALALAHRSIRLWQPYLRERTVVYARLLVHVSLKNTFSCICRIMEVADLFEPRSKFSLKTLDEEAVRAVMRGEGDDVRGKGAYSAGACVRRVHHFLKRSLIMRDMLLSIGEQLRGRPLDSLALYDSDALIVLATNALLKALVFMDNDIPADAQE